MKHPVPLRYSIPAALALLVLSLTASAFIHDWIRSSRAVEALTLRRAAALGHVVTLHLERLMARNDGVAAADEIDAMHAVPHLSLALVCDDRDQVRYATDLKLRGQPLAQTPAATGRPLVARARETLSAQMEVSRDGTTVRAAFPFKLGLLPGELRSSRTAIFYTETDLVSLKSQERVAMMNRSLVVGAATLLACLGIWYYLHRTLTRRAASLVAATRELAAGNLSTETALHGSDELASVGESFNRMAAELRQNTGALRRDSCILAQLHDAVVCTDLDGRVTYWNEAATRLLGWTAEETRGRPFFDQYPPEEHAERWQDFLRVVAGEVSCGERLRLRKNGTSAWVSSNTGLYHDAAGRAAGVISVAHDITARRQAEEKLGQQLEELQRWHAVTLGREDRVQELKHEVNDLLHDQGLPPRYPSQEASHD